MLVIILDIADAKMDKTTLILTDLHCGGPEIAKKKKNVSKAADQSGRSRNYLKCSATEILGLLQQLMSDYCTPSLLNQTLVNFFCREPDYKYFQLLRPYGLCHYYWPDLSCGP